MILTLKVIVDISMETFLMDILRKCKIAAVATFVVVNKLSTFTIKLDGSK